MSLPSLPPTSASNRAPLPPWTTLLRLPDSLDYTLGVVSTFFLESYKAMGPVYRFRRGERSFTVLSGLDANLFMSQEGKGCLRAREFRADQDRELGIEKNLVSMDGEEHERFRRLHKHGYSRAILEARLPELVEVIRALTRDWAAGDTLSPKGALPALVGELLGVGVLGHPLGEYLEDVLVFVRTVVIETVSKIRPRTVLNMPTYHRAKARCMQLADEVIEAHRRDPPGDRPRDVVDDLLDALARDEHLLTEQELRIAVLGGFIGGLDTVVSTCCFLLYAVHADPGILERVQADVDAAFREGPPSPSALRDSEALHGAVLETLRRFPVSPAVQGTAARTFELAGFRVDEGSELIVATTVPHHLPELFPDPHAFDIDRYRPPRNEHHRTGAFAPYGIGPHLCLGAGMADLLISLVAATLLHDFRLELSPPDYRLEIEAFPTPLPKDLRLRVLERRTGRR